jgi:hypothetical protein
MGFPLKFQTSLASGHSIAGTLKLLVHPAAERSAYLASVAVSQKPPYISMEFVYLMRHTFDE